MAKLIFWFIFSQHCCTLENPIILIVFLEKRLSWSLQSDSIIRFIQCQIITQRFVYILCDEQLFIFLRLCTFLTLWNLTFIVVARFVFRPVYNFSRPNCIIHIRLQLIHIFFLCSFSFCRYTNYQFLCTSDQERSSGENQNTEDWKRKCI